MKLAIVCVILLLTVNIVQAGNDITGAYSWSKNKIFRELTITKKQGDTYHFKLYGMNDTGADNAFEGEHEFDAMVINKQARFTQKADDSGINECNIVIKFSMNTADVKGHCSSGVVELAGITYKKVKKTNK